MTAHGRVLRRAPSEAEKRVWKLVRRQQLDGLGFRRQHAVGPYVLDFYCPSLQIALEIDGGQHAAPHCVEYDSRRTAWLGARGIEVIRFWNNDVLSNIEGVWTVLMQAIDARRSTPSLTLPLAGGGNAPEPRAQQLGGDQ
ncbi:endonuclease domain-containing protein [Variibacter gotjawalensis]|nr:endonuclease domain-containing protein [Variibacter gotjawalensis]